MGKKDKTVSFSTHYDYLHTKFQSICKKKKMGTRTNPWIDRPQDKNQYTKINHISAYCEWKVGNCDLKIYHLPSNKNMKMLRYGYYKICVEPVG